MIAVSAVFFAAMAVFGRLAGYRHIPGSETAIARFVSGLAVVLVMHRAGVVRIQIRRPGWLLIRGLSGGLGNLFLFLALSSIADGTPITNAVLLGNSYFVFAPIFGLLLIKEKFRPSTVMAVLMALVGIYLVVDAHIGHVRMGDVIALIGGVTSGLAIVAVRELRKTESAASVFFALNVVGTIISIAVLLLLEKPVMPDAIGWLILAAVAISSTCAQYGQTYAFRFVRAGEGSVIAMTTIVYSSGFGVLVLGENFSWNFAVGAVLVFASAVFLAFMRAGGDDV